jgi:RNA-directed DNA polymerase
VDATKPYDIPKKLVVEAFKAVKANSGGAGVDGKSIEDFETDLKSNLYKIWNRMSSGAYFPSPVKGVTIPKKSGGERMLGVPTVSDRVAQMVVKLMFEPMVEPVFLSDSYGYRPGKSALDAVGVTRERCWKYDWVFEFDVKGLFDNIDHGLLMKAVKHHTQCKWVLLYVERWLKAPMQMPDGTIKTRSKGTPQGGVISPVLSNLFLHYVFDTWMTRNLPENPWCRYADDGLVHCKTEANAKAVRKLLTARFAECGLELHPTKSRIVYCKDGKRRGKYENMEFDFLGFSFRRRGTKNSKLNIMFCGFVPAASKAAIIAMRQTIRKLNIRNRTELSLEGISRLCEPILRGWWQYYGQYYPSAMNPVFHHFNRTLSEWAKRKFKGLKGSIIAAEKVVRSAAKTCPQMFSHWQRGCLRFA